MATAQQREGPPFVVCPSVRRRADWPIHDAKKAEVRKYRRQRVNHRPRQRGAVAMGHTPNRPRVFLRRVDEHHADGFTIASSQARPVVPTRAGNMRDRTLRGHGERGDEDDNDQQDDDGDL
jgi:hypothetical protein